MNRPITLTITILLILFIAVTCEKETPLAPSKTGVIEMFPNTLGSQWIYHMTDNLRKPDSLKPGKLFDIVAVSISDRWTDPETGLEATIWRYIINERDVMDRPVVFIGDTVYIYWNWAIRDRIGLIFPFDAGDSWHTGGIFSGDETIVKEIITMRVPAGLFEDVFVLENVRRTTVSTDSRTITLWYVPNLGPIKIHLREKHAESVGDSTWILVNYNFPGFKDN